MWPQRVKLSAHIKLSGDANGCSSDGWNQYWDDTMSTLQAGSSVTSGYSRSSRGWWNRTHEITGGKVTCHVQIPHVTGHPLLCGRAVPSNRWRQGNRSSCGTLSDDTVESLWGVEDSPLQESISELSPSSGFHIRPLLPSSSLLFSWHQLWPRRGFSQKATWLSLSKNDEWDPDSIWKNRTRIWSNSQARADPVTRFVCSLNISLGGAQGSHFKFITKLKRKGNLLSVIVQYVHNWTQMDLRSFHAMWLKL